MWARETYPCHLGAGYIRVPTPQNAAAFASLIKRDFREGSMAIAGLTHFIRVPYTCSVDVGQLC